MASPKQPWIPTEKIADVVQLEPALVLLGLSVGALVVYKLFLRGVSRERHNNLRNLFMNLSFHFVFGAFFFALFWTFQFMPDESALVGRVTPYVGLVTLISGAIILVKVARIYIFEYLFLGHMKEGVPLLLVNMFTLLMSIILGAWIASDIFGVRLTPVLATSAIFSIVLGLALQDTLGNLFAGLALQMDKPYEIGDWVEVHSGGKTWSGQVLEISWRSTVLISFTEELITIPNRTMGQAQVSNFTLDDRPIVRSHVFRVPYLTDLEQARQLLVQAARETPQIVSLPEPVVIITEAGESWITLKLVYYINNYGSQYSIGDQVITRVVELFAKNSIQFAAPRIAVVGPIENSKKL